MRKLMSVILLASLFSVGAAEELDDSATYERVVRSVVLIRTQNEKQVGMLGSGVLVEASKNEILTCYHVIADSDKVFVQFPQFDEDGLVTSSEAYKSAPLCEAEVVGKDAKRDLALIRLKIPDAGRTAITFATRSARPGQRLLAIGSNPERGSMWRCSVGNARQVYRSQMRLSTGQEFDGRLLEMTVPINPGDSGGPVVDQNHALIGITFAFSQSANQDYRAVDLSEIRSFLDAVRARETKSKLATFEEEPFSNAMGSVVLVASLDENNYRGWGTGVIVGGGEILTSSHVTPPNATIWIILPQFDNAGLVLNPDRYHRDEHRTTGQCEIIARDTLGAMTLLRVTASHSRYTPLRLAKSIEADEEIATLGIDAQGQNIWQATRGRLNGFTGILIDGVDKQSRPYAGFKIDHRIPVWHIGGPVLSKSGELGGLIIGVEKESSNGLAISVTEIRAFLEEAHAKK